MRVLDPRVTNPVYRFHHRADQKMGAMYPTAIVTLGSGLPLGASIFVDGLYGFLCLIGLAGFLSYSRYYDHSAEKLRLTELMQIKAELPAEHHHHIDRVIADVYHCKNNHESYHSSSRTKVLNAGHSCEYCGERIIAARELLEVCKEEQSVDNSSLEGLKEIVSIKRAGIEEIKSLENRMTEIMAEVEAVTAKKELRRGR